MDDADRAFAAELGGFDEQRFREFLIALWQARGQEITDPGAGPLRLEDETETRLYPLVASEDGSIDGWPDVGPDGRVVFAGLLGTQDGSVVAEDSAVPAVGPDSLPDGITAEAVIDANALREWLRYGISDAARDRIVDRFFDGASPSVESTPDEWTVPDTRSPPRLSPDGRRTSTSTESRPDRTTAEVARGTAAEAADRTGSDREGARDAEPDEHEDGPTNEPRDWPGVIRMTGIGVVAIGLVLAAIAGGFGGLAEGPGAEGQQVLDDPGVGPDYLHEGDTTLGRPTAVTDSVEERTARDGGLPPGVGRDGEIDEYQLADATAAAFANTSVTITITHRERVEGIERVRWRERITVADEERYASTVTLIGSPEGTPVVDQTPVYRNGSQTVGIDQDGTIQTSTADTDTPIDRLARYVRWFLSVEQSRIADRIERNGTTYYWLQLVGDPWPGVENTTGSALIDERGRVHEIHRTYTLPDRPEVVVTVTIRVTDIGETSITRPSWARTGDATETATTTAANRTTTTG